MPVTCPPAPPVPTATPAAPQGDTALKAQTASKPRAHWRSFDLLRGLAAALMVVNHVGYMLTARPALQLVHAPSDHTVLQATALQWATLIGAFAPVAFFFITGLGYGIQAGRTVPKKLAPLVPKLLVLFAADALMWRTAGHDLGLDFFGFIALSMILLAVLLQLDALAKSEQADAPRWLSPSVIAAGLLLLLILGLRIVGGPFAERVLGVAPGGTLDLILGRNVAGGAPLPGSQESTTTTESAWSLGFSFPPIPWLAYPLAGFVLGAWLKAHRAWLQTHRALFVLAMLGVATLSVLAVGLLLSGDGILHRWGTVSVAFIFAGFAVLAVLTALATAVEERQGPARRVVDALSLRGIAAFSVVPLHFLCIALLAWAGFRPDSVGTITLSIVGILVVSLLLAPRFVPLGKAVAKAAGNGNAWWWWLAGGAITATLLMLVVPGLVEPYHARRVLMAVGQLVLCVMLVLPSPRRSE